MICLHLKSLQAWNQIVWENWIMINLDQKRRREGGAEEHDMDTCLLFTDDVTADRGREEKLQSYAVHSHSQECSRADRMDDGGDDD